METTHGKPVRPRYERYDTIPILQRRPWRIMEIMGWPEHSRWPRRESRIGQTERWGGLPAPHLLNYAFLPGPYKLPGKPSSSPSGFKSPSGFRPGLILSWVLEGKCAADKVKICKGPTSFIAQIVGAHPAGIYKTHSRGRPTLNQYFHACWKESAQPIR